VCAEGLLSQAGSHVFQEAASFQIGFVGGGMIDVVGEIIIVGGVVGVKARRHGDGGGGATRRPVVLFVAVAAAAAAADGLCQLLAAVLSRKVSKSF
jgi:hypothetical protein